MDWLYILALICVLLGLINGSMGLKSMRSKTYPQAEIAWNQPPLSPWRYETPSMAAISIHTLGLIGLTAFLLFSLARHSVLTFPPKPDSDFLLFAISLLIVMFTSYISGVISAYHLVQPWMKPVSYGITQEGMLYAGSIVSWQTFSHHEAGPEDGLISLYSSYSPGLRTWVLQPPSELFANVLEMIRRSLPSIAVQTIDNPSSWQRSPLVMMIWMTFLVLGALIPAAWGWFQGQAWVWMYAFLAFLFVLFLGNKLITVFDGRGNASVKREAG